MSQDRLLMDIIERLEALTVRVDNLTFPEFVAVSATDHGSLAGLADDDHPQYLLIDGTRAMTGDLEFGGAGTGIIHTDGVQDGKVLRANGTRYVPATLDISDLSGGISYGAPNFTFTTVNAEGVAAAAVRTDASLAIFDANTPEDVDLAAASAGVQAFAARRDHKHDLDEGIIPTWTGMHWFTDSDTVPLRAGDGVDDYSEFEADGTLHFVGDATVWDDLQVNISSVRLPASGAPSWTTYRGSRVLEFSASQDNVVYFTAQLPHSYLQESDIDFHIHTVHPDTGSGNSRWVFTYSWADINEVFHQESTVEKNIAAPLQADLHQLHHIAEPISGTGGVYADGYKISSVLLCSLTREGTHIADTYASGVYLVAMDFHFEIDTVGSRTETNKDSLGRRLLETGDQLLLEAGGSRLLEY